MDFPQETYNQLIKYSNAEELINVTVINQFEQEFTISGFIPKIHKTRDMGYECKGAHSHYIILNFGVNDNKSTIKLFCPNDTTSISVHPLTIKKITDNYGNTIYKNENYPWVVLKIRKTIYENHLDFNYWKMSDTKEEIAQKLLGKAPVYLGYKYPELRGKNCLIVGVTDGLVPNTIAIYLKHENFKTFGIERLKPYEIEMFFDFGKDKII